MKQGKINRKKDFIFFKNHHVIDLIFFLLLILNIYLDISKYINPVNFKINNDIIIILLPSIITIISITISMSGERILGVSRSRFNKLRSSWTYNFLEMIIITIIVFVIYTTLVFLPLKYTILFLELLCIYYTVVFSLQEIPFLLKDDKTIKKTIREYYWNRPIEKDNLYAGDDDTLSEILIFLVFKEGIKTTYLSFLEKRNGEASELMDELFSIQNNCLHKIVQSIISNTNNEYKGIDVIEIMDRSYRNILDLFFFSSDYNYCKIYKKDKIYLLTRSIFSLHNIINSLNLYEKQRDWTNRILVQLILGINKNASSEEVAFDFLNTIIVNTVPSGNMWFVENLRDFDFFSSIFSFEGNLYGYFCLIYFYYLAKICKNKDSNIEKSIFSLISSKSFGISDNRSWLKLSKINIQYSNDKNLADSLHKLIKIYNSSQKGTYYANFKEQDSMENNINQFFDKFHIFDCWLELVLFNNSVFINEETIESSINKLSDEDKKNCLDRLCSKWKGILETNYYEHQPFLSFVGIESSKQKVDENIRKYLLSLIINHQEKQIASTIEILSDEEIKKYANDIKIGFNSAIENFEFLNKKIDLKNADKFVISQRINSSSIKSNLELYIERFPESLYEILIEEILSTAILQKEISGFLLDKNTIDEIIKFAPDFMSKDSTLEYNATEEQKKIIKNIIKKKNIYLPMNLFWKEGAIEANFEYSEDSIFRRLNNEEIDKIIDNRYENFNGLYKFKGNFADDSKSLLITREKLFDYIKESEYFFAIFFKCKINIDKDKIFLVKHNYNN